MIKTLLSFANDQRSRKLDNKYTCFCDYKLKEFKTKLFKLDEFRNLIPGAESNVIYLGKSSKKKLNLNNLY